MLILLICNFKLNKRIRFLLGVINIFSRYALVIPLKDKKEKDIWVDKDSQFYKRLMKSCLQDNIEMHSRYSKAKSVAAERFIRTSKNKIYKYMTSILKIVCINKLDDMINRYNNTYHRTIKMKLVDVKSSIYNDFNKKNNKDGPKFKFGDNVRISKYKKIFAKACTPNWSEEVFVIKKF